MSSSPFPQFGNILAPAWFGFSPVLKGLRDLDYDLDLPPVLVPGGAAPSGGFARGNALPVDSDADFLVRELQFTVTTSAVTQPTPANIRVRIRDGDGRLLWPLTDRARGRVVWLEDRVCHPCGGEPWRGDGAGHVDAA